MASGVAHDDSAFNAATTAVRLECWLGAVPAVFRLAPDEVCGIRPPRPFHLALPRQSMLPFVCEAVRAHFAPFGPPLGGELWFEHSGTPLRWQLPIGVLFDLLVGEEGDASAALPWAITVHFASFPSHTLLKATRAEAEAVLLNALKESCYLRCGSALPAMSLSPADQEKLTTALGSFDESAYKLGYAPVAAAINEATANQLNHQPPRSIPVRVFTSPTAWRQQPFAPRQADGSPSTLRSLLEQLLPAHFDTAAVGGASGASGGDGRTPRVTVQGVAVPLDVSLVFLASALCCPDGWLYVCIQLPARVPPYEPARPERAAA